MSTSSQKIQKEFGITKDYYFKDLCISYLREDLASLENYPQVEHLSRRVSDVSGFRVSLKSNGRVVSASQKFASFFLTAMHIAGFIVQSSKKSRKDDFDTLCALFSESSPKKHKVIWQHQQDYEPHYANYTWMQLYFVFKNLLDAKVIDADREKQRSTTEIIDLLQSFFICRSGKQFKGKAVRDAVNKYISNRKKGELIPPTGKPEANHRLIVFTMLLCQLDQQLFNDLEL
jgi:hypothetical protein